MKQEARGRKRDVGFEIKLKNLAARFQLPEWQPIFVCDF